MCFVTYYRSKYAKINPEIFVFCYLEIICKKKFIYLLILLYATKTFVCELCKDLKNITLGIFKKKIKLDKKQ